MKPIQPRLIVVFLALINFAYAEENPDKQTHLTMGFYSSSITEQANRSDIEVSLNFWAKDLLQEEAKKLNLNITTSGAVLFDRIEDLEKAFERGELDMIVAPPLLISQHFKRKDLGDGFMGVLENKKSDYLLIIARTDKNINSVKDLRGKRLVMQEKDELADMFLDTEVLKELRKGYKSIGLTIQHQKKSNRLALDVFFDKADAAVIYGSTYEIMSELNPEIRNKIKILAKYPVRGKNFGYFRHNYPFQKQLSAASINFKDSARAKQILEVFRTPEIDNCKVADLDSLDKFYKDYLQLKQRAKK